jgi:hypothetical protein
MPGRLEGQMENQQVLAKDEPLSDEKHRLLP